MYVEPLKELCYNGIIRKQEKLRQSVGVFFFSKVTEKRSTYEIHAARKHSGKTL